MGTQPKFDTWRACGPENRISQAGPAIVVEHNGARSARRAARARIVSACAFTANERQSRLQLTQHEVREPRMRCWGHCGRELCYFRALAYLDRWRAFEQLGQVRQNSNRARSSRAWFGASESVRAESSRTASHGRHPSRLLKIFHHMTPPRCACPNKARSKGKVETVKERTRRKETGFITAMSQAAHAQTHHRTTHC